MRRRPVALVLVLLLVLNACAMVLSPPARAQEATPGSTPIAESAQVDLPAVMLLPEDIDQPGFAIGPGITWFPEDLVAGQAELTGVPADEILATLIDAGYERTFYTLLERPAPAGPGTPIAIDVRIELAVTEYTSAAGAAAGFAYLDGTLEDLTDYEDIPLTRVCLLYTSPSPRDGLLSRMPSSA